MRRKTLENTRFYTFSGALLPKMGKIIQHLLFLPKFETSARSGESFVVLKN
jgi:hypothetical protein